MMSPQEARLIIEIRRYRLQPGKRETFIQFFEQVNRPALRDAGMLVFGPMRDLEDPDVVHWMRAFATLSDRERIKDGFYDGSVWLKEVEPRVMPLIAHFEASVVETTEGFETFSGSASLL
ncbi:putative quinol monooxygenase [Phaeobacter inhibens]|uniref:putative quinol monooxygenase n=1 Tax=Phaeobacter inhibens TaxID=221822 RepID=UPI0021A673AD|nr:antibiotic biosynthesis monooxygenase [Phaeobacter inhibens]UWR48824.1 antibiotic biosynthesis monooxygenase [Phaeobacter inhibens]UWR52706.1 antibiotic biosynthesis monooxygenase [Phaeobacter inhibens]